jgi:methylated-DNA-[protein]-cysteine S-methyltransferase
MTATTLHHEAWDVYASPIGPLTLQAGPRGLTALRFPGEAEGLDPAARNPEALADATEQLDAYFAGERRTFDLELDLHGTAFQRQVWSALRRIPAGETLTYTELARELGRPQAARAIGAAVGATPVPIVVPCHRVVGSDGRLTGYRGGLERKRALLDLERR